MSKIILKFNLPEEKEEANVSVKAIDLYLCLSDIDILLRNKCKYDEDKKVKFSELRKLVHDILDDRGVSLDMMS